MTPAETGHPFLCFVNTVTDDDKRRSTDSFANGGELVAILSAAGLVPRAMPAPGAGQLAGIRNLRETAHAVLSAMAAGRKPGREESLALETAIKATLQDATLVFGPGWSGIRPGPLGGIHDHLVLSLFDLLQRGDLGRLRECARCSHLFIDQGRGPGRRWCAMARCGNRAKAESFRARRRSATG
jgi:predicted RNA-binding Zn ribbon-like protein